MPRPPIPCRLADAVTALPIADESRDGYTRGEYRHWNTDTNPAEVATLAPRC